ncbi:hypothetical protein FHR29_002084 [Sphingobacterium sp. JUb56]|nr:hypothetical protein [Sphingobacterium sp. JUb56]
MTSEITSRGNSSNNKLKVFPNQSEMTVHRHTTNSVMYL